MFRRFALLSLVLLACNREEPRKVAETYDYLVTPSGQRFRVIGAGPVRRGANTKLGVRISYVAQGRSQAELVEHADTLVRALGPEMSLPGEPRLVVRARLGPPTLSLEATRGMFDVEYQATPQGFARMPHTGAAPDFAAVSGTDDPSFPYSAARLTEAATIGALWLAMLDRHDMAGTRAQMSKNFREQVADDARFGELLAQRQNAGIPGVRRELYRMQQRSTKIGRKPGDDVLLVYECQNPGRRPVIERLSLARWSSGWKVSGYVFQPLPEA